jgi:ZIP family zinc transporter
MQISMASLEPILLSAFAGSATGIGGLLIYLFDENPSDFIVSQVFAFAAGVMMFVSIFDLMLPTLQTEGYVFTLVFTLLGAMITRLLLLIHVPEPEELVLQYFPTMSVKPTELPGAGSNYNRSRFWNLGFFLALILTVHNFPEGIAVGVSAYSDVASSQPISLVLTIAIFVHNIAEGFLLAVPIYLGTGNKRFAFLITCLSALSEPFGALFGLLLLGVFPKEYLFLVVDVFLITVAGIMLTISVQELLPRSFTYAKKTSSSCSLVIGFSAGCLIITITMNLGA